MFWLQTFGTEQLVLRCFKQFKWIRFFRWFSFPQLLRQMLIESDVTEAVRTRVKPRVNPWVNCPARELIWCGCRNFGFSYKFSRFSLDVWRPWWKTKAEWRCAAAILQRFGLLAATNYSIAWYWLILYDIDCLQFLAIMQHDTTYCLTLTIYSCCMPCPDLERGRRPKFRTFSIPLKGVSRRCLNWNKSIKSRWIHDLSPAEWVAPDDGTISYDGVWMSIASAQMLIGSTSYGATVAMGCSGSHSAMERTSSLCSTNGSESLQAWGIFKGTLRLAWKLKGEGK